VEQRIHRRIILKNRPGLNDENTGRHMLSISVDGLHFLAENEILNISPKS
jgi:hypothetical protein